MDWLIELFDGISNAQAAVGAIVANMVVFVLSISIGQLFVVHFADCRITIPPEPIERREVMLATSCVLLNSVVMWVGWRMWQYGWINVTKGLQWKTAVDVAVLFLSMDLLMYVFHRIAHIRWIFPWVHSTHHLYDRPRPLSLFVLNPIEVLGFGGLWLALLCVYTSNWTAICIYLFLNVVFGTMGHLGVEPFGRTLQRMPVFRHFGSSTFHATHHQDAKGNFGFYTDIWDRIFGTLRQIDPRDR